MHTNLFKLKLVPVPGKIPLLSTEQTKDITDYAKQFSYQRNLDMILKWQHWNICSLVSRASNSADGQLKRQIASGHAARVVAVNP